jgi:hypothetical protein
MRPTDLFILGLIAFILVAYKLLETLKERRVKAAASAGERAVDRVARAILEKRGYGVRAAGVKAPYQTMANGRLYKSQLPADLIAVDEKSGRRYAVLVETSGDEASQYGRAEGRAKLLPLQILHGTHGVLVVDVENEKINVVRFRLKTPPWQMELCFFIFLAGVAVGAVVAALLLIVRGD